MAVAEDFDTRAHSQLSPSRTIKLVGLTLALGYLIVLGGIYLQGDS
jgi:hypothetical protein